MSGPNNLQLPSPQEPISEPRTGIINRNWFYAFTQFSQKVLTGLIRSGSIVVGHVAIWASDGSLADGGALASGITQLTGPVTAGPGSGSQATTITNAAVTLAKIANAAASSKVLGSGASGAGASYAELSLGSGLSITGTTLSATGSGGTVTTTGSPTSGNLTKFSGASAITNGDLSGDVTTSGTLATTLATSGVAAGTYGDAANVARVTVDAKGRVTAAANVPITGGTIGSTLLEQHTASSSASLNFTTCLTSAYDTYLMELVNLVPATDGALFQMRVSTDGGSTYDAGANYGWATDLWRAGAQGQFGAEGGATLIDFTGDPTGMTNNANWGTSGYLTLYAPLSTAVFTTLTGRMTFKFKTGSFRLGVNVIGSYESTTAVNAFQFFFSSGNIASGTIRVYGMAK